MTGDQARLDVVQFAVPPSYCGGSRLSDGGARHRARVGADPNRVASTSPAIVTNLLKNQLGFHGLVVTDALDMAGLTRLYGEHWPGGGGCI